MTCLDATNMSGSQLGFEAATEQNVFFRTTCKLGATA